MLKIDGVSISPSIASADQLNLEKAIRFAEERGCDEIHIDVEDGNFIPNITFGEKTIRAIHGATGLPLSFHLMTNDQFSWLNTAAAYRPSVVFGHVEQLPYPGRFIGQAAALGVRCGFALNPKETLDMLAPYIGGIPAVLLLSVEPDKTGELFMQATYKKISDLRTMSDEIEIWVDGNVTPDKLAKLAAAGATHAVVGRAFFEGL